MQAIKFIKEIERMPNPVFLINDAARIIGKSAEYARVYMHRLKQRRLVYEIEKGKYSLSYDPAEVASNLILPSYISFISAYSIYGMTTQIPTVFYVVAAKSKKPLEFGNGRIEFIKFKKENIFGYSRKNFRDSYIFLAEPEKAIADSLYLPDHCPISESHYAIMNHEINKDKIINFALQMGSIAAIKRLGYLMELKGMDAYPYVYKKLNNRYDLLNPFMKKSKLNSSKWKLNINEEFE